MLETITGYYDAFAFADLINIRLKIVGEITVWQGHSPKQIKAMKDGLAKLKEQGIEAIED